MWQILKILSTVLYLFAALLYCLPTADYILLSFAWHSFPSESFALQPNCILSDTGCQVATCIFFQIEQSFSCPIRPQINIPFLPAVRFPIPFSYENICASGDLFSSFGVKSPCAFSGSTVCFTFFVFSRYAPYCAIKKSDAFAASALA